jgi:hypothetical protein
MKLGLSKKIESALYNTGLFSSVAYGEKGGEDSYHKDVDVQIMKN